MIKTLTFYSNYFNHHQKAFCDSLESLLGEGFTFVETEPMEEFRSRMGWGKEDIPSYVLKSHRGEEERKKAFELALSSDVVIIGTAPEELISRRMEENRLTFRYSERPLKEGRFKIFIPRLAKKFVVNHISKRKKELYILAAGAFVSSDYRFLHSYIGKCYKFGYFPKAEEKSFEELQQSRAGHDKARILWAGRFLKLKRADLLIRAAKSCRDNGADFELRFVGDGEEEKRLKGLVKKLRLSDVASFTGFLSPEDTRREMEEADIFVCTSNKLEGWGSVIYEALSAGLAVIATSKAGATPFLIREGKTGLVFESGNAADLAEKLMILLHAPEEARRLGQNAYDNMQRHWNPEEAAKRLLAVSERLLSGEHFFFEEGPLSYAQEMKEGWYRS
ncbi:MAG: glycosyltransferase [Lachnospiraceae bacterium]|nr:glycosyltransferase [Lachnospiraceae bacterium]